MNIDNIVEDVVGVGKSAVEQSGLKTEGKIDIIKSEMNSDSKIVRLARPLIILVGLAIIVLEIFGVRIGLLMSFGADVEIIRSSNTLIEFFIVTWSGIVSVYVFHRTKEKKHAATLINQRLIDQKEQKVEIQHKRKLNRLERRKLRRNN